MFGTIDRPMLTSGATEGYLKMTEITFDKTSRMMVHQGVNGIEKRKDLPIVFQKVYNRLIQTCEGLILVILTGVMGSTAVKDISASVSGIVCRKAPFKGEGVDRY